MKRIYHGCWNSDDDGRVGYTDTNLNRLIKYLRDVARLNDKGNGASWLIATRDDQGRLRDIISGEVNGKKSKTTRIY